MRPKGSAKELEVRRRIGGKLLLEGKGVREVARLVGVSSSSAQRWKDEIEKGGMEALKAKPHPGRKSRLSTQQKKELMKILLTGPVAAGYITELWTCKRVAEVIERYFSVKYHHVYVWNILRDMGFTCQMPDDQGRERDEEAIQNWRKKEWPRIKKSSKSA